MPAASLRSDFLDRYFAGRDLRVRKPAFLLPQAVRRPAGAQPAFDVDDRLMRCRNQGSMCVRLHLPDGVTPAQCFRHDVNAIGRGLTQSFEIFAAEVDPPGSTMRRAFCSASSKLRPMAITSPTDFIDDPMLCEALRNFCRSQRGAFTVT